MSEAFAEVIDEAMRRKGWGYNRLSVEIGLLEGGRIFNPTQIRRLRLGERQNLSRELVQRLIDVLDLDPDLSWHAAGLWPPDLDVEGYRRYRQRAFLNSSNPDALTHRLGKPQGRVKRMGVLIPFPLPGLAPALELGRVA